MNTEWIEPVVEDEEAFRDFRDALDDYAPKILAVLSELRENPADGKRLADLFRHFHSIKGDAGLCRLLFAVGFVDALESLLMRVRDGALPFTPALADLALLVLDRLELAIDALGEGRAVGPLRLDAIARGIENMAGSVNAATLDASCARVVATFDSDGRPEVAEADLAYFRQLAMQLEQRSPKFSGRTSRNLQLALLTNELAGKPVDPLQLEAAVYMHDVCMMLLPETVWVKAGPMSEDDRQLMWRHTVWAGGLLERMPGWAAAARMVREHHEKPDGSGYPVGLAGDAICDGARVLAIVDAFEAVLVRQASIGIGRSVLRAAAEINASAGQFDPRWVAHFNQAVQKVVEGQAAD